MELKRFRKGKEVSTFKNFDSSKFSSFGAKIRFEKAGKFNKGFIMERGMKFNNVPEGIDDIIAVIG